MIVTQILQMAFAGLVADRTIQRMVQQKKFNHTISGVHHSITGNIFYYHAVHYRSAAACYQFGHWPWISGRTCCYLYQTSTAFTTTTLQLAIKAHGRWCNIAAD